MNRQACEEERFWFSSKSQRTKRMSSLGSQEVMTASLKVKLYSAEWDFRLSEDSDRHRDMWPCYWTSVKNVSNLPSLQSPQISKWTVDWLGKACLVPAAQGCCPGRPCTSSVSAPRRKQCPGLNLPETLSMRSCSDIETLNYCLPSLLTSSYQTYRSCCFYFLNWKGISFQSIFSEQKVFCFYSQNLFTRKHNN